VTLTGRGHVELVRTISPPRTRIYHITIDNSYPYWVYGSQQDAGAIRTRSPWQPGRDYAADWNPVSGWEWGTTIPDPLNPDVLYASARGF